MKRPLAVWFAALLGAVSQVPQARAHDGERTVSRGYGADGDLDDPRGIELTLGVRELYDDNLYRLPESLDSQASRDDYIRRISAGLGGNWQWSRQKVLLNLLATNSAYERNDQLDNTSGRGRAEWEWRAGNALSGALGGDFSRTLVSFSNTRFFGKDLLDSSGVFASLGFRLGPSWSFKAAGRSASTEHSANERRFDNFRTDSVTAGLHFKTSSESEIGVDVRRTEGDFDRAVNLSGQLFDRDYVDESASLELNQILSPRTRVGLKLGYLSREYGDVALADVGKGGFSGAIGDVLLQWQASNKIMLNFNGWRRLRAYLDAESDYFVSEGASVAPTWQPSDRISVELELGFETQDYLGASANLQSSARADRVRSGKLQLSYSPLRKLHFDLIGSIEERESDRDLLEYESQIASFGVRWTY